MSRTSIALLLACALSAALVSQLEPRMVWVSYAFFAFVTAGLLDRRARAGKPVVGLSLSAAVFLAGAGGAAYGINPALWPLTLGTFFCAGGALLVAFRHHARTTFRFLTTRAAFYGVAATLLSVFVVAAVVSLNVLAARHPLQIDVTRAGVHSLSEETMSVLGSLRQRLRLHAFYRPDEAPARGRVWPVLRRYADASPLVAVELHDPDRDPALATRLGVRADGPRVVAEYGVHSAKVLPRGPDLSLIDARDPQRLVSFRELGEADVTTAILRATRVRPRVCFLGGHGERSLDDENAAGFSALRELLADQNLEGVSLSLGEPPAPTVAGEPAGPAPEGRGDGGALADGGVATNTGIVTKNYINSNSASSTFSPISDGGGSPSAPLGGSGSSGSSGSSGNSGSAPPAMMHSLAGCKAVIIAGARATLFAPEAAALRQYVQRGGGLVVLAEPGVAEGPLGALFAAAGLRLSEGTVSDPGGETRGAGIVAPREVREHAITHTLRLAPAAALYLDGARIVDAVSQSASVLLESAPQAFASPLPGSPFASGRDRQGPLPLAAAAPLGQGRLVVVGDSDLCGNRYLRFAGNQMFTVGVLRFAAGDEKPVVIKPQGWQHSRLTWTDTRRRLVRVLTQAVLPGLALFFAIYLWRTRRRL